ncbi:MAG: type II toxin-antitoxin system HicB family antitoxin [Coprothermobacterota bacterium]|nr:type II toxin-antitoxin system HicB family antitoxin [Coprothermobacterota bacterium]
MEVEQMGLSVAILTTPSLKVQVDFVIEPDEQGFHGFCPALKGLHVDGKTEAEVLSLAREAIQLYLSSLIRHGDPLPIGCAIQNQIEPSTLNGFSHPRNEEFTILIQ